MKTQHSTTARRWVECIALLLAVLGWLGCGSGSGGGSAGTGSPPPVTPGPSPSPTPAPTRTPPPEPPPPAPSPTLPPGDELLPPSAEVVAIGDSITAGEGASFGWPEAFAAHLAAVGRGDVHVHNEGSGGLSSRELWLDDPHQGSKRSAVNAYPSIDLAFLMIGHNDVRTGEPTDHSSPDEYQRFVGQILGWLHGRTNANGHVTQVVVLLPIPAREPVVHNRWGFPADFNEQMQQPHGYRERLAEQARDVGALVIDTLPSFDGGASLHPPYRRGSERLIGADTIHPIDAGQQVLADLVFDTLHGSSGAGAAH